MRNKLLFIPGQDERKWLMRDMPSRDGWDARPSQIPCGVISIHVELGEKREVIIMGVTILMSFDVLERWAKGELLERMPNFVKNVPIGGKCSRWRLVAGGCRRGIERCPFFIKQVSSWKGGLVGEYLVNEGKIITCNDAINCLHGVAILKQAEKEAKKGQHAIPFCVV
jgi:hypothetical protein